VWLPWRHFLHYGDARVLKGAYANMVAYVDYLWAHHECWADFVTFEKKMIDQSHEDAEVRRRGYSKLEAAAAALSSVGYHSNAIINLGGDSDETTFVYDAAFDARHWAAGANVQAARQVRREQAKAPLHAEVWVQLCAIPTPAPLQAHGSRDGDAV
jgi:hypothetical protein